MTKQLTLGLSVLGVLWLLAGCANQSTATVSPGTDLGKAKTFYVVKQPRDSHDINRLIRDHLVTRGYTVTTGPELPASDYRADIVATYRDRWAWDITLYLIELNITFRAPESGFPMATGNSLHTSLTRKSPEEMVDEVLSSIFNKAKQGS